VKIAVVTDTHFGARQESPVFLRHATRFFENVFFPECDRRGVRHILHLGDVLDKQKQVNFLVLEEFQRVFIGNILSRPGLTADILIGNHDVYYRNTSEHNSLRAIFQHITTDSRIRFVLTPEFVTRGGIGIHLAPWVGTDEMDNFRQSLLPSSSFSSHQSSVLAGHLEVQTFALNGGAIMEHGLQPSEIAHYKMVLSGHFHSRQTKGNIHYIGTPYQLDWGDYGQPKGFAILDTETLSLDYINNSAITYHQFHYDPELPSLDIPRDLDLTDCFARVFVRAGIIDRKERSRFDAYTAEIAATGATVEIVLGDAVNLVTANSATAGEARQDYRALIEDYVRTSVFLSNTRQHTVSQLLLGAFDEAQQ
jgi:DNA repair exonuclease SbcCD nuclease subunit